MAACQQLVKERPFRDNQAFCEMVEKGLGSKDKETKLAIRVFGQVRVQQQQQAGGVWHVGMALRPNLISAASRSPVPDLPGGCKQACTIGGGLPGVLHLIAKYENDLPAAIKANIAAGGDSNGRYGVCLLCVGYAYCRGVADHNGTVCGTVTVACPWL